jgi:ubiquinone/menaquinone biosynthesis C-methylase UbiE/predicted enzyme related to lactoylglutathione lyase
MADELGEILAFDHIEVTVPRGGEARAKRFYGEVLGLREVAPPAHLATQGSVWYRCGGQQLYVVLNDDFSPQRTMRFAFLVRELDALQVRLEAAGAPVTREAPLPGVECIASSDPFGNRMEFLLRLPTPATETPAPDARAGDEIRALARDMFGRAADAYVASPGHAAGSDLQRLVELAAPEPGDSALDISTGGGHTALALAPNVGHMVASDLTPRMLAAARTFIGARGIANVDFVVADAERLPFLDTTFTLVTARIAPHHYADIRAAVKEMARVLAPGGRLVLEDNIAPEDPLLDALVNDWDRRRDPSHVREYTVSEWRDLLGQASLEVTHVETVSKAHDFTEWVERMRMPDEPRRALERDILGAPPAARDHFKVIEREGRLVSWTSDFVILRAERS